MKIAKICNEWELPFNFDLKSEDNVSLHNRSYLHYAAEHPELVSAKCWATKWLLEDIIDMTQTYTAIEYMAGIGVQSLLIQKLFNLELHVMGELDEGCVEHLSSIDWNHKVIVNCQDAKKSLIEDHNFDLKFLDLPNSSILQVTTKWKNGFNKLFESNPKLVVWTDTSITYPISIHGEKYGNILNTKLETKFDYINAYSAWLFRNFGYTIKRAAIRGTNAVYFAAVPGLVSTTISSFPIATNADGFYFIGEEKSTLDAFF